MRHAALPDTGPYGLMTCVDPQDVRRFETGAASARSLLLTVLGEFVRPRGGPAWTGALVAGLAEVGVEEKAARQALARTAADGLLASERAGRRVRWRLTPRAVRLLTEGADRIYGFGQGLAAWDGRWLMLMVTVPESQRQLRHRLRTRLTWAGLGSPTPGLWVTPDTGKQKEVAEVVQDLGVDAFSFTGSFGEIGDERQVVRQAWTLDEVERRYQGFIGAVSALPVATPADAFRARVRLVHEWRRFPFLDPALPPELLPDGWPGPRAARLFHDRYGAWHDAAGEYWDTLSAAAASRS
jgi:phenylacetic acid degradation operon negative regulatory protein